MLTSLYGTFKVMEVAESFSANVDKGYHTDILVTGPHMETYIF